MKKLMISAVLLSMLPCSYAYSMDPWADPYGLMDDEAASVDNVPAVTNNVPAMINVPVANLVQIPAIREGSVELPYNQFYQLSKNINALRSYLLGGGNPNVTSGYRNLLGSIAYNIERDENEMLELLLLAGADVNKKDRAGNYPLHYALYNLSLDKMKMLLEAGADLDLKDREGRTASQCLRRMIDRNPDSDTVLAMRDYVVGYLNNRILRLQGAPEPINEHTLTQASLVGVEDIPLAQAYYSSDEDNA